MRSDECHVQDFVRSLLYSFGYYALRTAVVEFYCFIVHRESSFEVVKERRTLGGNIDRTTIIP